MSVLMASIRDVAGGMQASPVEDDRVVDASKVDRRIEVTPEFVNERLGLTLPAEEIKQLLAAVECGVSGAIVIEPPFWRTDLELPEDIVEEVGRLYGFDKLPRELPLRSTKPAVMNPASALSTHLRESLVRAGASEVLTYSFVHERVLQAAGQDSKDAYKLSNALSPDLQYYRMSLTPSLLDKVHANSKAGYGEFALFEIGMYHSKAAGLATDGLPVEPRQVAVVYVSKEESMGAPFYHAKAYAEYVAKQLGREFIYEPLGPDSTSPVAVPFEPKRSAIITDKETGLYLGVVGEYKKSVSRAFKLPEYAGGFELSIDALLDFNETGKAAYRPLSRYPSVSRDLTLKVADASPYATVLGALEDALETIDLSTAIQPAGIYQSDSEKNAKHISFHITFSAPDRTLTSDEVSAAMDAAVAQLTSRITAEVL